MKYLIKIVIFSAVAWLPVCSQPIDSLLLLENLKREMLQRNPQFSAGHKRVLAIKENISQMGSLPDPQLNFGLLNIPTDTYDLNQEAMTQKMIGVSQKIPFAGKLGMYKQLAERSYHISNQFLFDLELDLINQLEKAYYLLYAMQKFITIMEENRLLLIDFVNITAKKYSSGKGIYQDVLKSQLELLQIEKKIIELNQQQTSVQAQMNTLLNRDQRSELGKIPDLTVPDIPLTLEAYQKLALENNPQIAAGKLTIEKSQLKYQLARRDYWPDFTLSLNYGRREKRPDFVSGLLAVNLPLYAGSKQARKVEQSKLDLYAASDQLESIKNEISYKVKTKYDEIQKHRELQMLYRDHILPQARQALASAIAAYQVDKVNFFSLLSNQISLLNYEMDYYKLISDYNQNISDLNYICGIVTI